MNVQTSGIFSFLVKNSPKLMEWRDEERVISCAFDVPEYSRHMGIYEEDELFALKNTDLLKSLQEVGEIMVESPENNEQFKFFKDWYDVNQKTIMFELSEEAIEMVKKYPEKFGFADWNGFLYLK